MPANRNRLPLVLVWIVFALLWFGTLGCRDLIHPDEGRYATLAQTMLHTGDWVTPRLNGIKYFEKPPLQYWATAVGFKLFGENNFAARLWPGITGFLTVLLIWFTGRRLWGEAAGNLAAIVLGSSLWWVGNGHFLTLDMGVSAFMTLTLCGFLLAQRDEATRTEQRGWMMVVWLSMALALLSKGLISFVLPGAILVLYSCISWHWRIWLRMHWLRGLVLFALVGVPWFILVSLRNPEFARFFFIYEHFERFLSPSHNRTGVWWYFFPVLLVGLIPWVTLLPNALRQALPRHPGQLQPTWLLLIWSIFIFFFFSLSDSKLPSYILPIFPALALLIGYAYRTAAPQTLYWHAVFNAVLFAALALGTHFYLVDPSDPVLSQYLVSWGRFGSLAFALLALLAAWQTWRGRALAAALTLALASLLGGQIMMQGHQVFSREMSARQLVAAIRPDLTADTPIYSIRSYDQTLPYYLHRNVTFVDYVDEFALGLKAEPWRSIPSLSAWETLWRIQPRGIAILPKNQLPILEAQHLPFTVIYQDDDRVAIKR